VNKPDHVTSPVSLRCVGLALPAACRFFLAVSGGASARCSDLAATQHQALRLLGIAGGLMEQQSNYSVEQKEEL